jgi:alkylated DNA repair dioxygenase AlkB
MNLFDLDPQFPPGFSYLPDFIDAGEEQRLVEAARALELHTFLFRGYEAKRKVASFGFDYHFDSRSISKGNPIPEAFLPLVDAVAKHMELESRSIAEILVTHYPVGSVINWHRDAPPFGLIAGVSLASDCMFRLRPYNKEGRHRSQTVNVPVARRSLYVMRDETREDWEHSIAPVATERFSVTLRTLRG